MGYFTTTVWLNRGGFLQVRDEQNQIVFTKSKDSWVKKKKNPIFQGFDNKRQKIEIQIEKVTPLILCDEASEKVSCSFT